jgi:putative SOS response-associated peptidase YedK
MCGRFSLSQSGDAIATAFQLSEVPDLVPRYNIAPTQPAPVLLLNAEGHRQFKLLYWGLIPSWAKDPKLGARMINARSETVAEKPAFRTAFKRRRCLVLADGFYEWQRRDKVKQPFYFQVGQGRQPFAFAGLWEHWQSSEGDTIDSCTILTTEPNELLRSIHDRMPVILEPQDYDRWLDPTQRPELLQPLLRPYDAQQMVSYAVNTQVNNPRHDRPDCIEPIAV